jgi:hypothetical protein
LTVELPNRLRPRRANVASCTIQSARGVHKLARAQNPFDLKEVRAKYHRYAESIVGRIVSPQARAAALELVPG